MTGPISTEVDSAEPPERPAVRRPATARRAAVSMMACLGLVAACTPGPTTIPLGLTLPIPPVQASLPPINVNLGLCNATLGLPGINIPGGTIYVPAVTLDPSQGTITVPNTRVNIPATRIPITGLSASCLGLPPVGLSVNLRLPASVGVGTVTVNLVTRVVYINNLTLTITGIGAEIPQLGGIVVPLPPVTVPLGGTSIAF